ncbi:MAG TPA: hypothetical protein VG798_03295 [Rhizomicrobium sp.]|nr:hypothetical protein [Rhizomicrobium sp.]
MKIRFIQSTLLFAMLCSGAATAGTVGLTLDRTKLSNLDDAAGNTQYEYGVVNKGDVQVGEYVLTRRVAGDIGSAAIHITLFFPAVAHTNNAPDNITIDGVEVGSGDFKGSVSAYSKAYAFTKNSNVTGLASPSDPHGEDIQITWNGHNTLTLPLH